MCGFVAWTLNALGVLLRLRAAKTKVKQRSMMAMLTCFALIGVETDFAKRSRSFEPNSISRRLVPFASSSFFFRPFSQLLCCHERFAYSNIDSLFDPY